MFACKYFFINAYKYLTAFVTKPSPSLSINLSKKTFGLEGFFPRLQNKRVAVFFLQQNKNKRVGFCLKSRSARLGSPINSSNDNRLSWVIDLMMIIIIIMMMMMIMLDSLINSSNENRFS